MIDREKVELVYHAARGRFMRADSGNSIITALEGLKWLLGMETYNSIEEDLKAWAELDKQP